MRFGIRDPATVHPQQPQVGVREDATVGGRLLLEPQQPLMPQRETLPLPDAAYGRW